MSEYNIDDEKVNDFILAFVKDDYEILSVKEDAIKKDIPIIRDETKNFLECTLRIQKPGSILELGTAIAYSTLVIYKACNKKVKKFVTVEENAERVKDARANIDKYFDRNSIELVEGDIGEYLKAIENDLKFDFIFLDAAKAQYVTWLPYIKSILNVGGVLLADNIFKDGEVLQSKYFIYKRDRTIHKRMREFLHIISKDKELDTSIFNIGDGISVSIKK